MIKGVLLDVSGVLIAGNQAIPGAVTALHDLRQAGLAVCFLTNSTRKPKRVLVAELTRLGFDLRSDQLLTPAGAAQGWLQTSGHQPHLLIDPALREDFAAPSPEQPVAVVLGDAGRGFTYDALNTAFRHLADGAPFVALAANRVFQDTDGALSLDAGAFVAALEHASGITAQVMGKPSPTFFAAAAETLGLPLGDLVMVGDDAEADVAGARAAGLGAAYLVRTGKYRAGDEHRVTPSPTATVADIGAAVACILAERAPK